MKVESIQAARAAYDIEAQCILEMKDYFDEVAFSRAVHLLAQAPRIGIPASSASTLRTSCAASSVRHGSFRQPRPSTVRRAFCRRAM